MGEHIAVLGAGPMGLAVAYQLARDGHHPIIFEAADRIGGMSASFDFAGLRVERFYHFHCLFDHGLLRILDELSLTHKMYWRTTKMGFWYQNKLHDWGTPKALFQFKGLSFVDKLRYGLHIFISIKRNHWHHLDQISAIDWIKTWVGKKTYDVLWRPLFDCKFYHYANDISAAWIWNRIQRIGRSRHHMTCEKLGVLEGGSETLLQALQTDIEDHGGEIKLNSAVQQVVIDHGKVQGIRLANSFHPFSKVVSTIPLPYVPKLMPALPEDILNKYQAIPNMAVVCVIAKLRRALTDNFWLNINDPTMDIPGLIEYTNLKPLANHIIYVPFYMPKSHPNYAESNHYFVNKVRLYAKKINPSFSTDDFIDMYVSRYQHAQPVCGTNFLDKLPPIASSVKGLWIADTSYYYPSDRGMSESIALGREIAKLTEII